MPRCRAPLLRRVDINDGGVSGIRTLGNRSSFSARASVTIASVAFHEEARDVAAQLVAHSRCRELTMVVIEGYCCTIQGGNEDEACRRVCVIRCFAPACQRSVDTSARPPRRFYARCTDAVAVAASAYIQTRRGRVTRVWRRVPALREVSRFSRRLLQVHMSRRRLCLLPPSAVQAAAV